MIIINVRTQWVTLNLVRKSHFSEEPFAKLSPWLQRWPYFSTQSHTLILLSEQDLSHCDILDHFLSLHATFYEVLTHWKRVVVAAAAEEEDQHQLHCHNGPEPLYSNLLNAHTTVYHAYLINERKLRHAEVTSGPSTTFWHYSYNGEMVPTMVLCLQSYWWYPHQAPGLRLVQHPSSFTHLHQLTCKVWACLLWLSWIPTSAVISANWINLRHGQLLLIKRPKTGLNAVRLASKCFY